ncbi:MAG: hypothetical protein EHM41_04070 [Chloroflexi bacterium]|nr:MAG: hypothetical protein EHM41_04070 [Chloroflexota bacterium]
MTYVAIFVIAVGILMMGQWIFLLISEKVPEMQTAPLQIAFHITAELLTSIILIMGGVCLLANSLFGYPLTLFGLGLLMYTVINSPGHFAQRREWPFLVMFVILIVLTLVSGSVLIASYGKFTAAMIPLI